MEVSLIIKKEYRFQGKKIKETQEFHPLKREVLPEMLTRAKVVESTCVGKV